MIDDRIEKSYKTKREVKSSNTQGAVGEINGIGAIGVARGLRKAEARLRLSCSQCMGLPPLVPPLPHLSDLPLHQLAAIFCSWSACIKLR